MIYTNAIDIKRTQAPETYYKGFGPNVELGAGSKKTRLQFSGSLTGAFVEGAANVYVEMIARGCFGWIKSLVLSWMSHKFVKGKWQNRVIYINVNSLSKRLGIDKREIRKAKDIHATIHHYHEKYLATEKKVDQYFQKLTEENTTQIDSKNLRKLLGIAAFSKVEGEVGYALKDKSILLLQKQEGEEWPLLTLFTNTVLGQGTYGRVNVAHELSKGRISAAKISRNPTGQKNIKNENTILQTIFSQGGHQLGIQRKPYSLFHFTIGKQVYSGYIGPKYDSNLTQLMPSLELPEKIACARQLLHGLVALEKDQICHGDIKSSNCLCRKIQDGSLECVIADFGGATDVSNKVKKPLCGTAYYRCDQDEDSYNALREQYKVEKRQGNPDAVTITAIKTLLFRKDVYAMGIVMTKLLYNQSDAVNLLVSRMINPSWKERISASDALAEFQAIFP